MLTLIPSLPVKMVNTLLGKQKHGIYITLVLNGPQLLRIGLIMMHMTLSLLVTVYFRLLCSYKDLDL